ncbi:nitroreductase [Prevotella pectinovora]|uniref:Nitroreductase n=1 Tax=Prevotella pectinovora TaxID=1602169 RepID=A0A0D0I3V7_9BACT|nr:nitroreductase family protein [Prevotella pectinovora]KIP58287.1 nitroreductase [Prevotella pectinovora]KIP60853.1 nitroreductase [Prevotella pectinovora]
MTLLEAISARHSVRKYLDKEIPADIIAALQDKIAECNKVGNLSIQLVQNETKAFTGMLSYGSFSGVKNYLVMVGKKAKDLDERVGYYGEQIVLLAQTLGLNTCWVGLSYRKVPEAYNVGKDEKLVCMIALGYGETQGVPHKIKTVEQVSNASDITPSWFKKGVEAALLAPTAVNQQKFSFEHVGVKNNRHQIRAKKGFSMIGYTKMDLGIARYHFEIGAGEVNFDWV